MIAGIGCRAGAEARSILAAIEAALGRSGRDGGDLAFLAAPAFKSGESGLAEAAARLGLPLLLMPDADLARAAERALTTSERVIRLTGLPSVAETAALAAAGPNGYLLGPRTALGPVTCALAENET